VSDHRKHRLILEIELPDFYAEESTPGLAEWMDGVAILIVESEGDKDSTVEVPTALIRSARLIPAAESAKPSFVGDHIKDARWKLAHGAWGALAIEGDDG
jgi:hypothetical protein